MITRKEIRKLGDDKLLDFRTAMMIFKNDPPKMYYEIAGYHGEPKKFCPHDDPVLFLAWHRYYMYFFEQELLKINPNLSLPYWNWTDENTFDESIAPAHKDENFKDSNGQVNPNPLYSALIHDGSKQTSRNITLCKNKLLDVKKSIGIALSPSTKTLQQLGQRIFPPHNTIHSLVGGDFSSWAEAAFDPLFWSHHATVDRQWAIWQERNPCFDIPDKFLCKPFENIKVVDVIDYRGKLGYKYDNLRFDSEFGYKPVVLTINSILTTERPFFIDVLLAKPETGEKIHASFFGIFGMGEMSGGMHHHATFNEYLDITAAIEKADIKVKDIDPTKHIQFEIRDENGNKANPNVLQFQSISID